jgi:hypothetical protein
LGGGAYSEICLQQLAGMRDELPVDGMKGAAEPGDAVLAIRHDRQWSRQS